MACKRQTRDSSSQHPLGISKDVADMAKSPTFASQGEVHRPHQGGVWNASDRRGTPPDTTPPALPRIFRTWEVSDLCHPKVNSTDHAKEEYGTQATDEGPPPATHTRHFQGCFQGCFACTQRTPPTFPRRNTRCMRSLGCAGGAKPHREPAHHRLKQGGGNHFHQTVQCSTISSDFITSALHRQGGDSDFGETVTCCVRLLFYEEGRFFQNSTRGHLWFRV